MTVDFRNNYDYIIPMKDFGLGYRFTDDKYLNISELHLNQIKAFGKSVLTDQF